LRGAAPFWRDSRPAPGQKPATADQQTGQKLPEQKPPEQKPPEQKSPEQKPIGQKPATPAQPPAPEQTPEQKAFSEASRTADLDKYSGPGKLDSRVS
jgi:hypothetical protein